MFNPPRTHFSVQCLLDSVVYDLRDGDIENDMTQTRAGKRNSDLWGSIRVQDERALLSRRYMSILHGCERTSRRRDTNAVNLALNTWFQTLFQCWRRR